VALVPAAVSKQVRLPGVSGVTVKTAAGSMDFAAGLTFDLALAMATPEQAAQISKSANRSLMETRNYAPVALGGFGPFMDAVKISAKGSDVLLNVNLDKQKVDDLAERLEGLLKSIIKNK
jgi:hypothetical protein